MLKQSARIGFWLLFVIAFVLFVFGVLYFAKAVRRYNSVRAAQRAIDDWESKTHFVNVDKATDLLKPAFQASSRADRNARFNSSSLQSQARSTKTLQVRLKNSKTRILLCAIIKGEDTYLDEWIAWNLAVGIDDVVLYDNAMDGQNRNARFGRALSDVNSHKVWVLDWPVVRGQVPAYNDCLARYGKEYDWIAFFDADEFLVLYKNKSIVEVLQDMPDDCAALTISWRLFCSGGKTKREPGCVVDRFVFAEEQINQHPKSIVRPSKVKEFEIHWPAASKTQGRVLFANQQPWSWTAPQEVRESAAQIVVLHHYFTKSKEEWNLKRARGRADSGAIRDDKEFAAHDDFATFLNDDAVQFANSLPLFKSRCFGYEAKSICIYILYYDDATRAAAETLQKKHPLWARPFELKQTLLLEGLMYCSNEGLESVEDEWRDCDFVGTLASTSAAKKIKHFDTLCSVFDAHCRGMPIVPDASKADALMLLHYSGHNALLDFHTPVVADVLKELCVRSGLGDDPIQAVPKSAWAFSNFWLARPAKMREYLDFFQTEWMPRMTTHPRILEDSGYASSLASRVQNASINAQTKKKVLHPALTRGELKDVGYFPLHTFLSERLVSIFAHARKWRQVMWSPLVDRFESV